MPDKTILVLDFVNWIRRYFCALRRDLGADETKLITAQSVADDLGKLIDGVCPHSPSNARGARHFNEISTGGRRRSLVARSLVHLIVENNVNKIFWPHARDRG